MLTTWYPPFCPNPECANSTQQSPQWACFFGTFTTQKAGIVPRFKCKACGKGFSRSTFQIEFRTKTFQDLEYICNALSNGEGVRSVARRKKIRPETVINRMNRLSRQAIALQAQARKELVLQENLAADGIMSYTWSQFFPTNMHVLVGSSSQYCYVADYAVTRRGGVMTDQQKKRRSKLDKGCIFPKRSVETSFARVYACATQLAKESGKDWIIDTDEHKAYVRAILKSKVNTAPDRIGKLTHRQTSSKLPRTVDNPLMAVNYMDREIRKDCANHTRETLQWSHESNNSMARLYVYMLSHNFFKKWRIKNRNEQRCHAELAGISKEFCAKVYDQLFGYRQFLSRNKDNMVTSETMTWKCEWPNPHNGKQPSVWPYMRA